MLIKEAPRNAATAWSPLSSAPDLLISGTVAGAFDDSFATNATLELFSLGISASAATPADPLQMQVLGQTSTNLRFHRLEWAARNNDPSLPYGIVAGGMDNGSITFWNPAKLVNPKESENPLLAATEKHTGPVKALDFNPFQQNLLASGASDSEIFVWDISNINTPSVYSPGAKTGQSVEITSVAWNKKVAHILGSATQSGNCVIWDLKARRPVINFSDSSKMKSCRAIAWNPDVATQIATSSDDERSPVVQLWDLRNAYSPVKEFMGHHKGILSLSWNAYDSQLLVSSGKDQRTLCWNSESGELICEIPQGNHWNFDVRWSPRVPSLLSSSSFGRKISVYSLQDLHPQTDQQFDIQSSQEKTKVHVPKWLYKPAGVSFGFGGKLLTFGKQKRPTGTEPFLATIHQVNTDQTITNKIEHLEKTIDSRSFTQFCNDKAQSSESQEQEFWSIMELLFVDEPRKELIKKSGFDAKAITDAIDEYLQQQSQSEEEKSGDTLNDQPAPSTEAQSEIPSDGFNHFAESSEGNEFNIPVHNLRINAFSEPPKVSILEKDPSSADFQITRALLVGDFSRAVDCCFKANRFADALLLAASGGADLWNHARNRYLSQQNSSFSKLVSAILSGELSELVAQSDLENWKETVALLATYAKGDQFSSLCAQLGLRLEQESRNVHSAVICYLLAGDKQRVIEFLLSEHERHEKNAENLLAFVEKVLVFRHTLPAGEDLEGVELQFEEYANMLATHGKLGIAYKYLSQFKKYSLSETPVLVDRIYHSLSQTPSGDVPPFPFTRVSVEAVSSKNAESTVTPSITHDSAKSQPVPIQEKATEHAQPSYPVSSPLNHGANLLAGASPMVNTAGITGYTPTNTFTNTASNQPTYATGYANTTIFTPSPSAGGYNTGAPATHSSAGYHNAPPTTIFHPPAPSSVVAPPPPTSTHGPAPVSAFTNYPTTTTTTSAPTPSSSNASGAPRYTTFVPHPETSAPPSGSAARPPVGVFTPNPNPNPIAPSANPPPMGSNPPAAQPTNPQPTAPPAAAEPPKPNPAMGHPIIRSLLAQLELCNAHPQARLKVKDVSKRIETLAEKINNKEVSDGVIHKLQGLTSALERRDHPTANQIQQDLAMSDFNEVQSYFPGLKTLTMVSKLL